MSRKRTDEEPDDERVSLAPLDPEEALRALLAVDPDAEPEPEPIHAGLDEDQDESD